MSTAKHTPGPWHINQNSEWICDIVTHHGELADGSTACWELASISTRRDEHKANARLIAAAPENYACNKELAAIVRALCEALHIPLPKETLSRSDKAIAKAEGNV